MCCIEQQQNKLENKGPADHIPTMDEDEVSVEYLQIGRRWEKQQKGKVDNPPFRTEENIVKIAFSATNVLVWYSRSGEVFFHSVGPQDENLETEERVGISAVSKFCCWEETSCCPSLEVKKA